MEIVKLPPGESAPREADCVSIEQLADGRYLMNASALANCEDGDLDEGEDDESTAVVGGATYGSYEEAEAAGLAWAAERCVTFLYIARGEPGRELPE